MIQADVSNGATKHASNKALTERSHEKRKLLHERFTEELQHFAFAKLIPEGQQSECVEGDAITYGLTGRVKGQRYP